MKLIVIFVFAINLFQFGYTEMKVCDLSNPNGSAKITWKDMNEEQKAQILEWQKENAKYILENIGKKCSQLKNIPEYTRLHAMHSLTIPPRTFGPDDICFSTSSDNLIEAYRTLGNHEMEFAEMQRAHETNSDRLDPLRMADWLSALTAAGRYREAEKFFPEFVHSVYPGLAKAEVVKKIKNRETIPSFMAQSIVADYWDRFLTISDKPDDLAAPYKAEEKMDISERMHLIFYRKDDKKRAEALEFYRKNKIKFMIEKAKNNWKGDLRDKAGKYLEELQKSTTAQ
jgi:hypothetical protein